MRLGENKSAARENGRKRRRAWGILGRQSVVPQSQPGAQPATQDQTLHRGTTPHATARGGRRADRQGLPTSGSGQRCA